MAAHPSTRQPRPHPHLIKQTRLPSPFQASPLAETSLSPETQTENQSPPLIVRDFAYMPRPPLLNRPIDEKWIVNIMLPAGAVPGLREREAIGWEASHRHLYRLGGNRADPPNTIPKTWGGLSKAEDDEMMRRAHASVREARERALALGLTPTEPNIGAPPQNYSALTSEEREAHDRVEASIRQQIAAAQRDGYEPLIETPPSTPLPLERTNTQLFSFPSPPSPSAVSRTVLSCRTSARRSKRKREETDNEHAESKVAGGSKRPSHKRRTKKQDEGGAAMNTGTPRYWLRRRNPSSPPRKSSTKHTGSQKGRGKARAS